MVPRTIGEEADLRSRNSLRRLVWMGFFRISIPLFFLLATLFVGIHFFHHSYSRNIMDVREYSHIRIGYEAIRNDIRVATSDLLHLAASKHMVDLLKDPSKENKQHLIAEFESILKTKKLYDQVRFIDEAGMEMVRVNYNSGLPLGVPEVKLQNKSRRYYFIDTLKLARDTVFVSPMDLNIENGRIEIPMKPMLRFGTPVFDGAGHKRGVLIINYYAKNILQNIKQYLNNPVSHTALLNAQGYWLMAADEKDEWGFMFGNERRFADRYPAVWKEMLRLKKGQINSDNGLFTFMAIYPLQADHISSSGARHAFALSTQPVNDREYFWLLVTHVPQSRLEEEIADHAQQAAVQTGLVLVIILPLAWLFSRERAHRKLAKQELRKNEQYMNVVTSQLAEGLLVIDRQGRVTSMNKEAERLLGWNSADISVIRLNAVLPGFALEAAKTDTPCVVTKAMDKGVSQRMENVTFTTKEGIPIPVSFSVAPFRHEGTVRGAIITFHDISEQLKMQNELKRMATHDPLTGTKNRGEIERLLAVEFERAQRYGNTIVLLMIDIDHFKKINDTYGHRQGDAVLQAACDRMQKLLRSSDMLGRYGGEEFLVILPETQMTAAELVAQRLCDSLGALPVPVENQSGIRFTASIGMAAYPESATSAEQLVQVADAMLYRAKNEGRNRVVKAYGNITALDKMRIT